MSEQWQIRYGEKVGGPYGMFWRSCDFRGLGEAEAKRMFERQKARPRTEVNAGVLMQSGCVVDCFG